MEVYNNQILCFKIISDKILMNNKTLILKKSKILILIFLNLIKLM